MCGVYSRGWSKKKLVDRLNWLSIRQLIYYTTVIQAQKTSPLASQLSSIKPFLPSTLTWLEMHLLVRSGLEIISEDIQVWYRQASSIRLCNAAILSQLLRGQEVWLLWRRSWGMFLLTRVNQTLCNDDDVSIFQPYPVLHSIWWEKSLIVKLVLSSKSTYLPTYLEAKAF